MHVAAGPAALEVVAGLVADLGLTPLNAGGLDDALMLERQVVLGVRPVRAGGRSPYLTRIEMPR